jgi:tetratricopeptide (TPR) repeat protein
VVWAIAVYCRTFSVPLLFDDNDAIVGNLSIRHWSSAFWPSPNTTASGRPILSLSLAVNYAISGTAVWSYHALNLAIHVLAGLTLFGIVRRTLARQSGPAGSMIAFSAALLWTLHPLQTESVTYIVQRAESLMGLFYLLTVYCFIRAVDADVSGPLTGRAPGECESRAGWRRAHLRVFDASGSLPNEAQALQPGSPTTGRCVSWVWYAFSIAACLLGMATKEVMVSAPLIVLLYDRTFVAGSFREAWRRRRVLHVALAATWLLLAGLVWSTGWNRNGASGFDVGISPWAYWLTQFEAVCRYLWLSVCPHPLVFEYGTFWVNRPVEVALYALVVMVLAAAVLVALWRRPALGFLGAWFFVILAPTSVIPGRVQMIVEHRMYLPLAAVMTLAAIGVHAAVRRQSRAVLAVLALGLGLLAALRNEDYRSELTIWSDTVAKRPGNERAHNNLGLAWAKMPGHLNDAISQYQEALRLKPDYAEAHNNLGLAWAQMPGRLNDATAEFEEALRLKPDLAEAHCNLGRAFSQVPGRLNDAIAQFEAALRLKPDYAEAHYNMGRALSQVPGRLNDAIVQLEAALRLKPDYPEAHYSMGIICSQKPGRLNDTIAEFEAVLRLKPDFAEAHNSLGLAWSKAPGRLDDAIAEFEAALRIKPDYAEAHCNLGAAWARMPGRQDDAITQDQEALRLKPDLAEAHFNLGVAWARMPGRQNDAIAQFEETVRLKPGFAAGWHNLGMSWLHVGNLPAAAAAFREELRLKPDDPAAQQALAAALQQAKDH